MKIFSKNQAIMFSLLVFVGVSENSALASEWYLNGKSTAKVESDDSSIRGKFHGLTVDCWSGTGKMRVWVKDFSVANGEIVEYETDKAKGRFRANKRYITAPHSDTDKSTTQMLIKALMSGSYIKFSSIGVYSKDDLDSVAPYKIEAKYSLSGSTKAIQSLVCTKQYLR